MIALLALATLLATATVPGGSAAPAAPAARTPAAEPARTPAARETGPRAARTPAPPPTHVEADHIEYRYKERQTVMTGKPLVTLKREDAVLVCRKLVADSDVAGDIQHAVCEGDVKLTRADRVVTCQRATYEGASGRVVCRGEPVLHDGQSVIHCDEVIYDLDQDRVFLKKPKGTLVQKPGQPLPVAKGKAR